MPPESEIDRRSWRRLGGRLLDWLYPPECALCTESLRDGRALCGDCHAALPRLKPPFCGVCGEMFDGQIEAITTCPNCRDLSFAFEFARPVLAHDPRSRDLIHRLKYGREIHLADELGRIAAEAFEDPRFAQAKAARWPLVPVPLHWLRHQHRHFNQSAEIVRSLARTTGLPVLRALKRGRRTGTQTRLTRHQRLENLRGAFSLTRVGRKFAASGADGVVLVDDVFTTGSTVHECARALRRGGVQNVIVVTVMRG